MTPAIVLPTVDATRATNVADDSQSTENFDPTSDLANAKPAHARVSPIGDGVLLKTRGVTSQKQQGLFRDSLVWKESITAKLRESGENDLAQTLERCHSEQYHAKCKDCSSVRTFWNRCENFYCPVCQPVLARERVESIEWWTKTIGQPKHVVLTARNTDVITFSRVKAFKAAFTKLRRRKLAAGWLGGIWSLEVTNEGRGWHLHMHALVDARWIDQAQLAVQWGKLVGQDYAIVAVKDCRDRAYLKEVTKYTVKGSELARWSAANVTQFVCAMQGQRTWGVFGSLYGKRTEWREWIESLGKKGHECKCGCTEWFIYDANEWEIFEAGIVAGQAFMPPPKPVPDAQQSFRL